MCGSGAAAERLTSLRPCGKTSLHLFSRPAPYCPAPNFSSTPVRDALMRLQEEGLVDVFPQSATVVRPINLEKAREAHFLRRSIEIEIVRVLSLAAESAVIERLR